ncbi:TonB-dependent receptor [Olivibacter ginsenosidimutans]|uniref:TonB-dependent receptor n=1 Tax=Olivibacter ginsenosidimutans TaxID=1176537 RepID=A0ABP9CFD7_9SPHI
MNKILTIYLLLMANLGIAIGQTNRITGKVTDLSGKPLDGVNISVMGTAIKAITNADGTYNIAANPGQKLIFSMVGALNETRTVAGTTPIDVQMNLNFDLEEVVVTGYQAERKKDLTGAVAVVAVKDIQDIPAGNPMKALQGRVPGVFVNTDGSPAGNASVRIRGIGTLGNTDPLYVIDGVPTTRGLQELNQNDIASIQVLKDASAASIYGSRAGNGVIIVTTKRAKAGVSHIGVNASSSLQFYTSKLDVLNTDERGRAYWQAAINDHLNPNLNSTYQYDWNGDFTNPILNQIILPEYLDEAKTMRPADTRWFDEISRTSLLQSYGLDISNGNEKSNTLFSLSYFDNQGILKASRDQKVTARFNSDFNLFKDRLKVGENFSATYMKDVLLPTTDITILSLIDLPIVPIHTIDGGWGGPAPGMADRQNPVRLIEDNRQNKNHFGRIFGNAYADLAILPNLHFKTNFGIDYAGNYARTLRKSYVSGFLADATNQVNTSTDYAGSLTWQNTLIYNVEWNEKHKLELLAGHEQIKLINQNFSGSRQGLALENINYAYLSAGSTLKDNAGGGANSALLSYFGKANYSFNDRYLASLTIRRDGSSRFGKDRRFGTFPAASLGWRLSEENFIKEKLPVISDLKLRYGWGITGNQQTNDNASLALYSAIYGTNLSGAFDGGTAYDISGKGSGQLPSGFVFIQRANDQLKWEEAMQHNIGLDFGLFDNKFSGSVDYFIKKTKDILISPAYLAVLGDGGAKFVNGASVDNKGLELVLNYNTSIGRDLTIDISANISAYRSKITKLPEEVLTSYPGNGTDKTILGRSVSSMFGYVADGLFTSQEEVENSPEQPGKGLGRIRYKDLNNDHIIDDRDRDYIGNSDPDFIYGINTAITYKRFDFSFFLQGIQGNSVYNTYKNLTDFSSLAPGANWGSRTLDAWTPQHPNSTIPALTTVDRNNEGRSSTYYVESGSYLKLRNIQLGYNLKDALQTLHVQQARIFLQASNLLLLKSKTYNAPDPENPGNAFPIPLMTTVGINLSF